MTAGAGAVGQQMGEIIFDNLAPMQEIAGNERQGQGEGAAGRIRNPGGIVVQAVHTGAHGPRGRVQSVHPGIKTPLDK